MKSLIISTEDFEGGAGRAANRLHQGLKSIGVASQMLVQDKSSDDTEVIAPQTKVGREWGKLRPTLDRLPVQLYPNREPIIFSSQWIPDSILTSVAQLCPDIINLQWVCGGYLQIETISKFNKPLVWTCQDMWAFTGGCHYNQDCDRYTDSCGACPQLHSSKNWDLSRWIWQRKAKAWKDIDLTIVTPSLWIAKCASSSSLFKNRRVEVIPNAVDIQKHKPIAQQVARDLLNLPQNKQLVLFAAMGANSDKRKGFHLLQPALQDLSKSGWQDQLDVVIAGASQPSTPPDLGFKSHYVGTMNDDISLVLVYAAADVIVVPSVQDNLPNIVMEGLACGRPCVAFDIGGISDMIEHQQNGYLAQPYKIEDLAQGIAWVLENTERHQKLCDRAREKIKQEFSLELQARRYLSLFTELVNEQSSFKDNEQINYPSQIEESEYKSQDFKTLFKLNRSS